MASDILDSIFANDPDGLLDVKPKSAAPTDYDRLLQELHEINAFYESHGKEPSSDSGDIGEYRLAKRLETFRNGAVKDNQAIYNADIHGLVSKRSNEANKETVPASIDDILADDDLGLLGGDSSIFELRPAVKKAVDREEADFVAQRKPCKDFAKYEPLFVRIQQDLKTGKRKLVGSKLSDLKAGGYYVYNGLLFFVESIEITQQDGVTPEGKHIYKNGRTRCIFENGTEAALLKRSVEKLLYLNGKTVTESNEDVANEVENTFGGINENDQACGFIYVCKSLSRDPKISCIENLYKIGFCTTSVQERIKNAEMEPTYLMAPVKHVTSWKCFNMNPQKFEQLIHNFFGTCCLNVDVFDEKGHRHVPKEWFVVPLPVIERAVEMIITGKIVKYRYDAKLQQIVER